MIDGHYEYSAITSNLDYTLANLWYFMAGRGNHEKTIAQLKSGLAFHTVAKAKSINAVEQRLKDMAMICGPSATGRAKMPQRSYKVAPIPNFSSTP